VGQIAVGTGELRQQLKALAADGTRVTYAEVYEESASTIAYYEALYPGDGFGSVREKAPVPTVEEQLNPPPGHPPIFDWDMGVFDLSVSDVSEDATFLSSVQGLWPDAGGRVVVLSERSDLMLAGFVCLAPELIDGTYVYIFDRFDPDDAIGVRNPHGSVYSPGYGWTS
jgi:hypothetical protein